MRKFDTGTVIYYYSSNAVYHCSWITGVPVPEDITMAVGYI